MSAVQHQRAHREELVELLVASFGPAPISTATQQGLAWHDVIEDVEERKDLLDVPARPVLDDPEVQRALDLARSAIQHGVVGTPGLDVTGVSIEEALGYAADLIAALDAAARR